MYTYAEVPGDKELEHFSIEHDRAESPALHQESPGRGEGRAAPLCLTLEPAGVDEDQRRDEARREAQARVPADLGRLLREVRQGLRGRGRPDLGADRPERGPGDPGLGVVPLHGQRGAGLRPRLPRAHPAPERARGREAHDLGPQPRPHVPAGGGGLQRPRGREVHLGHRLPLVRRRPLRQRASPPRRLPGQGAALHGGLRARHLGGRLPPRQERHPGPQPLDRGLDRLEPAARPRRAARATPAA